MKYLTQTIPVANSDNLFEFFIIDTDRDEKQRIIGTEEFVELKKYELERTLNNEKET